MSERESEVAVKDAMLSQKAKTSLPECASLFVNVDSDMMSAYSFSPSCSSALV